jgi:hypothetical protein
MLFVSHCRLAAPVAPARSMAIAALQALHGARQRFYTGEKGASGERGFRPAMCGWPAGGARRGRRFAELLWKPACGLEEDGRAEEETMREEDKFG